MRFLADESCSDGDLILALREAGHDVQVVASSMGGATDASVVAAALADGRVVITKDRDFGQLVFSQGVDSAGVIYVRWPVVLRERLAPRLVTLVAEMAGRLAGSFVVVTPGRIRVRHRPTP